jgi:hypothetical protein
VRRSNLFFFLLIPFLAAFSFGQSPLPAGAASNLPRMSSAGRTVSLPLVFEANRGQADGSVDFIAPVRSNRVGIGASRVILGLDRAAGDTMVMNLAGANQQARARGEEKLPGHSNYLIGSDSSKWITGVEQYAKVRYRDVYPGELICCFTEARIAWNKTSLSVREPVQSAFVFIFRACSVWN